MLLVACVVVKLLSIKDGRFTIEVKWGCKLVKAFHLAVPPRVPARKSPASIQPGHHSILLPKKNTKIHPRIVM